MRMTAALDGTLNTIMKEEVTVAERAVTSGVKRAGSGLQRELRRQVTKAKLGTGLEKAWRKDDYPRRGRSMGAASLVYSKATRLHAAFSANRTISAAGGRWLVVPLEPAIAQGWDETQARSRGNRPRGWANVEAAQKAVGRLTFVPLDTQRALLVSQEGRRSTAYFLLLKKVRLRKAIDLDAPTTKWSAKVPDYIAGAYDRADRRAR